MSDIALRCDKCGQHWRDVPMPEHDIDILDAFYTAIPEKFGTCMAGGERHAGAAAAIPLSESDQMWLRGLAAAFDAFDKAEKRREALRQMTADDDRLTTPQGSIGEKEYD